MKVSYKDFIHPQDDAARRELEAVPGFDMVTKCFLKFGVEKFLHGYLMATDFWKSDFAFVRVARKILI